ncbi:hypothetical protein CO726_24830 [Bacillus fungorum]|uniref:Uncharacterized protein n=1 Tax=Bacillus fungorum TaxID=2039284 RepID=A0A2G6Q7I0_9BACI|nr:hypothetical protein [Bacillus fungorum]PIE92794.1 hypothetical protein CO726_24830 [Bacillus fungorum]
MKMQYALWEIKERLFLVDAEEYSALTTKGEYKQDEPTEEESLKKLVYGSFKIQADYDKKEAIEEAKNSVGYALGHIKGKTCHYIELLDLELREDQEVLHGEIPFSALIRTDLKIPRKNEPAISAFLRYGNMEIGDNILNRFGIFAIKGEEKGLTNLTKENWKEFINEKKEIKVAELLK